jgi:hypothetical protein
LEISTSVYEHRVDDFSFSYFEHWICLGVGMGHFISSHTICLVDGRILGIPLLEKHEWRFKGFFLDILGKERMGLIVSGCVC